MINKRGKIKMEEYIEDILEDNDSSMELLEALDSDNVLSDGDWSGMMQDHDYFCNQ